MIYKITRIQKDQPELTIEITLDEFMTLFNMLSPSFFNRPDLDALGDKLEILAKNNVVINQELSGKSLIYKGK